MEALASPEELATFKKANREAYAAAKAVLRNHGLKRKVFYFHILDGHSSQEYNFYIYSSKSHSCVSVSPTDLNKLETGKEVFYAPNPECIDDVTSVIYEKMCSVYISQNPTNKLKLVYDDEIRSIFEFSGTIPQPDLIII
jgi:hypothetical protein